MGFALLFFFLSNKCTQNVFVSNAHAVARKYICTTGYPRTRLIIHIIMIRHIPQQIHLSIAISIFLIRSRSNVVYRVYTMQINSKNSVVKCMVGSRTHVNYTHARMHIINTYLQYTGGGGWVCVCVCVSYRCWSRIIIRNNTREK